MNRFERDIKTAGEARLRYLDGEYQLLSPGSHVRCAVTGQPIALEDLRYWSVDRQEPYANARVAMQRTLELATLKR